MKIWERIIERMHADAQFRFMPGRGMADAIFAVRQGMEKQEGVLWRRNREKGLLDNYVIIVQDMYEGARTRAKTNVDYTWAVKKSQ